MSAHPIPPSLPELDRRMRSERGAFVQTAEELKEKLRSDADALRPRNLVRRHPGAALTTVALGGLLVGLFAGRILAALFR